MKSKKAELIERENRMLIVEGRGWGKWEKVCQRIQTSSYNYIPESKVQHGDCS